MELLINLRQNPALENTLADYLKHQDSLECDLKELEMYKDPNSYYKQTPIQNENQEKCSDDGSNQRKGSNVEAKVTNNFNVYPTPNPDEVYISNNNKQKNLLQIPIPEKNKLFSVKGIIGDKNSLYRAVSEAILESEEDFIMLKFFVASFASRKTQIEELYNNFYMDEFSLTFYDYLDRIREDSFLVGELDIILISKILNIEITIYSLVNMSKNNSPIDFNNDYSLYSNLKIVNYLKCEKPYFTVDLLLNNLEDMNDNRNTYHLLKLNNTNPYYKRMIEKKNELNNNALLADVGFYDIKELENANFIRHYYFSNYIAPEEEVKPQSKFKFKLPEINMNEDMKLTIMIIVLVLAFLTLRRMF